MNQPEPLHVAVTYGDLKVEFSGTPEAVLSSLTSFLSKQIPSLDLASKIAVNYSVTDLINLFAAVVKMTPEGPRVWKGDQKLSDKDVVALQLVAARIGKETGKLSAVSLTSSELEAATGINPKSISSRLSELSKLGYVEREDTDKGVQYRITTQGVNWLSTVIAKKSVRGK